MITMDYQPEPIWCTFTFERLPDFCYLGGRVGHYDDDCPLKREMQGKPKIFGSWMRAPLFLTKIEDRFSGFRFKTLTKIEVEMSGCTVAEVVVEIIEQAVGEMLINFTKENQADPENLSPRRDGVVTKRAVKILRLPLFHNGCCRGILAKNLNRPEMKFINRCRRGRFMGQIPSSIFLWGRRRGNRKRFPFQ